MRHRWRDWPLRVKAQLAELLLQLRGLERQLIRPDHLGQGAAQPIEQREPAVVNGNALLIDQRLKPIDCSEDKRETGDECVSDTSDKLFRKL